MAKGKSGLSTTAGGGSASGPATPPAEPTVKHPVVDDIGALGDGMSMHHSQKVKWLKQNHSTPLSDAEAEAIIDAAVDFSGGGYEAIHAGYDPHSTDLIDSMIEDPKAPVYGKNSYRGMDVTVADLGMFGSSTANVKEWIMGIINSGVWKEPGVSSFSASKKTAMNFGGFHHSNPSNKDKIHILITNKGHSKGMPFQHISSFGSYEKEVLMSSKTMKAGMKIVSWHTNKAGNEFFIDVDDRL